MKTPHAFPPKTILVPTDMGAASNSALKYARYFHERLGSKALILHAHHFDLPPYFSSGQLADLRRELKRSAKAAMEYVRKESDPMLGFSAEIRVVENAPAEAILSESLKDGIDLVVMGMYGHGVLERLWLGSVTERVIRRSSVPVLAVRKDPSESPFQKILCPINVSDPGKQALAYAADISKALNAHLIVLHVVEPGDEPLHCPLVDEQVRSSCKMEEIRFHGNAARTIVEASNDLKPDLIVMGAEHKAVKPGEFFSSTTSSIMHMAASPLLIVPSS